MDKQDSFLSRDDRLLAKLGGRYILRMQTNSEIISSLIGASFGFYFIYISANLSQTQIFQLLATFGIFTALTNLLIALYIRGSTRQARERLDHVFKARPLPENANEALAWKEILSLPAKAGIAHVVFSYLLVLLPIILSMRFLGGANGWQIMIILISGTLVEAFALIQTILYMDIQLAPTRQVLLPSAPEQQDVRSGVRQAARPYSVIIFLLIFSQLPVGVLIYQNYIATSVPGANLAVMLGRLQAQLGIIGTVTFVLGLFLASRLHQAASLPIREMDRTIGEISKGNFSQRAALMSSDESAQLTIRLNQLLDQLQDARLELERSVKQRTVDLNRRLSQLQAAAQVARDATEMQEINLLLSQTANLISSRFDYYHTGIFLLDDASEYAVLQAASSEGGKRMLERGHRLAVGRQGIVGLVSHENRPHIAMDIGKDAVFFDNPDLPMTRSEAAVPLAARGKVIGVLDIQSTEASAFAQEDIEIFQTLADQIALAIQNARSLVESKNTLQRLESTLSENIRLIWRERTQGASQAYRYTSVGIAPIAISEKQSLSNPADQTSMKIPITLRGQQIGSIALQRGTEGNWAETDRSLATEIANQIGLALENARLLEDAQRRAAQEQSLSELTAQLSRSLDPDVLLQTAIRELRQLPNVSGVSVYLAPPEKTSPDAAN